MKLPHTYQNGCNCSYECPYCNFKMKKHWKSVKKTDRAQAFFSNHLQRHQHEVFKGRDGEREIL